LRSHHNFSEADDSGSNKLPESPQKAGPSRKNVMFGGGGDSGSPDDLIL